MSDLRVQTGEPKIGRRRDSRLRVRLASRLITLDGTIRAVLADLSQWGARIEVAGAVLRSGENAVLGWDGFEAFGTIVWTDGRAIGMRFEEPLSQGQLMAIRRLEDARSLPVDKQALRDAAKAFVQGRRWL